MKIGITGATGQLGQLVVEKLKKKTSSENIVAWSVPRKKLPNWE